MIELLEDARNNQMLRWWITFRIDNHWCQAKVYDLPSQWGINGGRVSKLSISNSDDWEGFKNCVYHYDRGLDFDNAPIDLVVKVLDFCDNLEPASKSMGSRI